MLLDQDSIGLPITVFAHLKLKQHDENTLEALERAVLGSPEVLECFSLSGGSDYVCRIVVESVFDMKSSSRRRSCICQALPRSIRSSR